MTIRWLDDAVYDLKSLRRYIMLENISAANKVTERILKAVDLLLEHPGMGRQGRIHNTRELVVPKTPYIIPYRVINKNIEILRVFHSSMQWPD